VLLSLTIHEAAHAWTAYRFGDPTAKQLGRLSLNPLVHIDLLGTIILPLIGAISNLPIIGWAKPVPVNISRLRQPRRDFMLVAAAGPASNLVIAMVAAIAYRILVAGLDSSSELLSRIGPDFLARVLAWTVTSNVWLALFNLIPVPPLDGGNVLAGLLPPPAARFLLGLMPFGFIILYVLMLSGALSALLAPPALFLIELLLP
jgi:Zn-dependent protease